MRCIRIITIITLVGMLVACSKESDGVNDKKEGAWNIATRVTGTENLDGIDYDTAPTWGLYAFTLEGEQIFANAQMEQVAGNEGYSNDSYKASNFVEGRPEDMSSLGGMILSAYYPYCDTWEPNTFPNSDTNISPRRTTNSNGHPCIHYGIPNYRLARHPRGGKNGYFNLGTESDPHYTFGVRDVVLFSCHKRVTTEELNDPVNPIKIELKPTTCRVAFIFTLAPRFDEDGQLEEHQPDTLDYEILSVRRLRDGHHGDPGGMMTNNFNYDLLTGEITDMNFCTEGLYFEFPKKGEPGWRDDWGPIRPYQYNTPSNQKISCLEFVCFPSVYDDLQKIQFEIIYRYRLIRASDPAVDEDIWVESTCHINASSSYLVQGWNSGRVYKYHVYISRHEVDYEVEIVPWAFDADADQFFGEIQV